MSDAQKIMLGTMAVGDAERLKTRLGREGIEIMTMHNGMTCSTGCGLKLEVWAHPEDLQDIGRLLAAERDKVLADLGADPTLLDQVFDVGAESATCPACGTGFATSLGECPECGLCFSVPNHVE